VLLKGHSARHLTGFHQRVLQVNFYNGQFKKSDVGSGVRSGGQSSITNAIHAQRQFNVLQSVVFFRKQSKTDWPGQ